MLLILETFNNILAERIERSFSSRTRGVFMGNDNPAVYNTMEFITISSTGNSADFGDLH
jgi:hypothetical protein